MRSDSGARDVGLGISEHVCTHGWELLIGFREKLGYTYCISKNVVGEIRTAKGSLLRSRYQGRHAMLLP